MVELLSAHRGNVGSEVSYENCRDNSKAAVGYALQRPHVKSIELDIRLAKDGLVVVHDGNTNKMHDTIHRAIRDLTVKELSETKWHDGYSQYTRKEKMAILFPNPIRYIKCTESKLDSEECVYPFEEMLDFILETRPNIELLLELKDHDKESAIEFSRVINTYIGRLKNIKAHGFDERMMEEVKRRTGVPTGLLVGLRSKGVFEDSYMESMLFDFMSISWLSLSKELLRKFYDHRKGFNVYTANNVTPLKRLNHILKVLKEEENIDFGIIGVHPQLITNVPDIIHDYIEKQKKKK